MWNGVLWLLGTKVSLLLSVCSLIAELIDGKPGNKKWPSLLRYGVLIVITVLVAIPAWFVFGTWSVFG